MPYSRNKDLPEGVKNALPRTGQTIWRKAFNSALEGTCDGDEECAAKVAWSAVKKVFKKEGDKWVKKQLASPSMLVQFPIEEGPEEGIPFFDGVDLDKITESDPDPMFVTLPIFKIGLVSRDGLHYTKELIDEFLRQMADTRKFAYMGHDHAFAYYSFDLPSGVWVGAKLEPDGLVWGKAYITDEEARKLFRTLEATGGQVGTSIAADVKPQDIEFDQTETYRLNPETTTLISIDFGPQEQVALRMDRPLSVTNQFDAGDTLIEEDMEDLKTVFQAHKPEEILAALPESVRSEIASPHLERISEFEKTVAAQQSEIADLKQRLARFIAAERAHKRDKIIAELVNIDSAALREFVAAKLSMLDGTETEEVIRAKVTEILESQAYKELAQAVALQLSGGKAFVGGLNEEDNGLDDTFISETLKRYGLNDLIPYAVKGEGGN